MGEMFYARYPSVWKWYFGYMHSQNEIALFPLAACSLCALRRIYSLRSGANYQWRAMANAVGTHHVDVLFIFVVIVVRFCICILYRFLYFSRCKLKTLAVR